jgi:hypothetical protein
MPHDRVIIIIGALLVAAAGFLYRRQKSRKPLVRVLVAIALCGVSDACAETAHKWVLTQPDKWLILHWNPNAVSGPETWIWVLLLGLVSAAAYYFFWSVFIGADKCGVDSSNRRRR